MKNNLLGAALGLMAWGICGITIGASTQSSGVVFSSWSRAAIGIGVALFVTATRRS
jgi:hypothetical protein